MVAGGGCWKRKVLEEVGAGGRLRRSAEKEVGGGGCLWRLATHQLEQPKTAHHAEEHEHSSVYNTERCAHEAERLALGVGCGVRGRGCWGCCAGQLR